MTVMMFCEFIVKHVFVNVGIMLILFMINVMICAANECKCEFPKHHGQQESLQRLMEPLCGKRYNADDDDHGYTYTVGICDSAMPTGGDLHVGAVQAHKSKIDGTPPSDSRIFKLGSILKAEIMTGTNWLLLEYEGGDPFGTHCSQEEKRTLIMITCNPSETVGKMRWIEENNNKSEDCYYLFELEHYTVCTVQKDAGLSAGYIFCIFVACSVGIYLIGGVLFMRLVRSAKGLHQIPHYSFWRDFGALQADGCDLICRCGTRQYDSKGSYHGIGDHQIECAADAAEEYDDRILPM